ncbi:MAG: tetratricopeptide repeat protein [Deltaproteobacteria bacterium]|nr:tetratricopeptide repeat protein [Deltaproteobacteria bacterium]
MRALAAVVGVGLWLVASAAGALSAGEIASRARAIGGATGDAATEQQRVAQLGDLTLEFIEVSDNAARSGTEASQRAALKAAFEAIDGPLDAIYTSRATKLESLTKSIMEQDGDLDALYETADFQQSQAVAAQSLYYRNWLRYYGGRVSDGARRKELLSAAEKGFSEFAVGDQKPDLLSESVLGRGLSNLELGDTDAALRDFKLVLDDPRVSAERKAKARLAMLDAYLRAGRTQEVLRYSDEVLKSGSVPAGDVNLVKFVRLQTLFDAADKAKGAEAERYRREAAAAMDALRGAGKGWQDKVDALMIAHVDDPKEWAGKADTPKLKWELARLMLSKNDYDGATPLLREVIASQDAAVKGVQGEAHYWLGVARFKANDFAASATELDAALAASPDAEWAGEARYLRFKALESMMAQPEVDPALAPRYLAALQEFLDRNPTHPMALEARYRLGESLQSQGDFTAAIVEYAKVQGEPAFMLRARFGSLQSRFELLKGDSEPSARTARLDAIGQDLDAVDALAKQVAAQQKGGADVALEELQAKATLLRAVYVSLKGSGGDEQVVVLLADFDKKFPKQTALLPQAVRLRLGALASLNRFADAEAAVKQFGPALKEENRPEALDGRAGTFSKAAARRKAEGDAPGSEAAARTSLALFALVGEGGGLKQQFATAQLLETTKDWAGAAKIYQQILAADPKSLVALRGLARIEEQEGRTAEALAHWAAYGANSRPGDAPWYQSEYQQARLTLAKGDKTAACERLTKLRPAMPGLTDLDLKRDLNALYEKACG